MNEKSDDQSKWIGFGAAAFVSLGAGFGLRYWGRVTEPKLDQIQKDLLTERVKEKRDALVSSQEKLTNKTNLTFSAGTSLEALALGLAIVAVLLFFKVRIRRAVLALAPALLFGALYSTTLYGIEAVVVFSVLGVALISYSFLEPDPKDEKEIAEFRKFPTIYDHGQAEREILDVRAMYREPAQRGRIEKEHIVREQMKLLKVVPELPPKLWRLILVIGGGKPERYLQLQKGIAYFAFVHADETVVSDYMTVLMMLDEPQPTFVARPLPYMDGATAENGRAINNGLRFKNDPEFTSEYLVELGPNADAKRVRAFLTPDVRDQLLELPNVWLHVERDVMALTIFGPFKNEVADHLVEVADFIFGEYGAEGGPSLFEPDDAEIVGPPVMKKKKMKKSTKKKSPGSAVPQGAA
ncbi:MAG: hypothetical protein U0271_19795 [Polyangiaceae bacterium]